MAATFPISSRLTIPKRLPPRWTPCGALLHAPSPTPTAPPAQTAPPPPPAPPQGANLAATWAALFKECQAAVAANPALKDPLQHAAAGIPDLIKANNVKDATAKMEALKALLHAPPAAPPHAPPPPSANLAATWAALLKEAQAAVAANPALKDVHCARGGRHSRPDQSQQRQRCHDEDGSSQGPAAPPHEPPPHAPAPPANLVATWNELVKEYQAAVAADPARKDALVHAMAGIPDLIKSNPAEAEKKMDALAAMLAAPPTAPPDTARREGLRAAVRRGWRSAFWRPSRTPPAMRASCAP